MTNILWPGMLLMIILVSCAGENGVIKNNSLRGKKDCYREEMPFMMTNVRVPQNFQSIYEVFAKEIEIKKDTTFVVDLEAEKEYWIGAQVLPGKELIRLFIRKDGKDLAKNVSSTPQIFFSVKKSGDYDILLQTHLSDCADKVLVSVVVAERKEKNK